MKSWYGWERCDWKAKLFPTASSPQSSDFANATQPKEECAFIIGDGRQGNRVELNAMDSQKFIDWLTKKLEEHGVKKVVPAPDVLESVYRLAILNQKTNEAIARVQAEWGADGHVDIPLNLEGQVRDLIAETPELSWDEAVSRVASPDNEEEAVVTE